MDLNLQNIPDHFSDEYTIGILQGEICDNYQLSLGLLLKIRKSLIRVIKKYPCIVVNFITTESKNEVNTHIEGFQKYLSKNELPECLKIFFGSLIMKFLKKVIFETSHGILDEWDEIRLEKASYEIARKEITLSPNLKKELDYHNLHSPRNDKDNFLIHFNSNFVHKVYLYHKSVERPEGTFSSEIDCDPVLIKLSQLEREMCPGCNSNKQIYCGECLGMRMPNARSLLPNRIALPFDISIIIHWHETLVKCTGIHSAVMAEEGCVSVFPWTKQVEEFGDTWGDLVASFDPEYDVLLFPCDKAIPVDKFEWNHSPPCPGKRFRLIVLEASWTHGKTMFNSIVRYREGRNLPPLRCVSLFNIVGKYWRFHGFPIYLFYNYFPSMQIIN